MAACGYGAWLQRPSYATTAAPCNGRLLGRTYSRSECAAGTSGSSVREQVCAIGIVAALLFMCLRRPRGKDKQQAPAVAVSLPPPDARGLPLSAVGMPVSIATPVAMGGHERRDGQARQPPRTAACREVLGSSR